MAVTQTVSRSRSYSCVCNTSCVWVPDPSDVAVTQTVSRSRSYSCVCNTSCVWVPDPSDVAVTQTVSRSRSYSCVCNTSCVWVPDPSDVAVTQTVSRSRSYSCVCNTSCVWVPDHLHMPFKSRLLQCTNQQQFSIFFLPAIHSGAAGFSIFHRSIPSSDAHCPSFTDLEGSFAYLFIWPLGKSWWTLQRRTDWMK